MSNSTVLGAVVTGVFLILGALLAAYIKRIEGKDRLFRSSVTKDMRVMYALKDDYSSLHDWALVVRTEWRRMQHQLLDAGAITTLRDLPPIPEPDWRRIEEQSG